jgi:uncharacterized protein YifE (UPF0438 family)
VKVVVKRRAASKLNPIVVQPNDCLKAYRKNTADYTLDLPEKSLYADVAMKDSFINNKLFLYAKEYDVPFQKSCTLSIKPPATLLKYGDKLCLAEVSGKEQVYSGGNLENNFVKTSVKNFGAYKVSLDTAAPKIKFIRSKTEYKGGSMISFKVSDDFSGIGKFKLTINDVFQLAEYEHKTGMIFLKITENAPKGKVKVRLVLDDKKNNRVIYETGVFITQSK